MVDLNQDYKGFVVINYQTGDIEVDDICKKLNKKIIDAIVLANRLGYYQMCTK